MDINDFFYIFYLFSGVMVFLKSFVVRLVFFVGFVVVVCVKGYGGGYGFNY